MFVHTLFLLYLWLRSSTKYIHVKSWGLCLPLFMYHDLCGRMSWKWNGLFTQIWRDLAQSFTESLSEKKFSSHCPLKLLYKLIIGKKSFSFIELDQLLLIPVVQLQRLLHTVLQLGCRLVLSFWRSLIIILLHFLQAKIKFHKITSLPYPKKMVTDDFS